MAELIGLDVFLWQWFSDSLCWAPLWYIRTFLHRFCCEPQYHVWPDCWSLNVCEQHNFISTSIFQPQAACKLIVSFDVMRGTGDWPASTNGVKWTFPSDFCGKAFVVIRCCSNTDARTSLYHQVCRPWMRLICILLKCPGVMQVLDKLSRQYLLQTIASGCGVSVGGHKWP